MKEQAPTATNPAVTFSPDLANLQAAAAQQPAPPPASSLADDPELVQDFVVESNEHLAVVEQRLLDLEKNPSRTDAIHATFRSFHTIKGLAGFLGFSPIQDVAHETETLLDLARSGKTPITPRLIDAVLKAADFLKEAIGSIERGLPLVEAPQTLLRMVRSAAANEEQLEESAAAETATDPQQVNVSGKGTKAALKVDADKIERLIDMVGELVIAQSMLCQNPTLGALKDPALSRCLAQMTRVIGDVQKTAMSMRMGPVSGLFQKVARLVREVSRKAGKNVVLRVAGENAELDRKILDGLSEPLVHMVRNSIDHGIETPDERRAAGKKPAGVIGLRAERESGNIVIEITDDGKGLNTERIRAKAIERGLIGAQTRLSREELQRLIFEPGFSTAEKITELSGRGVGMDVVRKQVENLRGRVEIRSVEGQGTSFTVRVPLTLATVDGLLVRVGRERYILPTFLVREIFRVAPEDILTVAGRAEMVRFRNSTLPVIRLASRLKTRDAEPDRSLIMIVAQSGAKEVCLAADEVIGEQEVVIKSLGSWFRDQNGIAGGAILGDGRVGLILDLDGLLNTRYVTGLANPGEERFISGKGMVQ